MEPTRTRTPTLIFSTRNKSKETSKPNNGVTSTLISQLAVVALKLRLAQHSGVSCDVNASSKNLFLKSSVGPVTVRGRGWESPLGLTCRAIDANVETCTLDMNSVLNKRKLILVTPAVGKAMVALDPKDFGSFLTHPLLTAQSPSLRTSIDEDKAEAEANASRRTFEFSDKDVEITDEDGGVVVFYGNCMGERWRCELMRGSNASKKAVINVSHEFVSSTSRIEEEESLRDLNIHLIEDELESILATFFNELVFELDGTFLSFQDMKIHRPKNSVKHDDANVLIALGITVKKFPSPGVAF